MVCDPSVLPLSAINTSPTMPERARKSMALAMQMPRVSDSLRQGMRIVSSTGSDMDMRGLYRGGVCFNANRSYPTDPLYFC